MTSHTRVSRVLTISCPFFFLQMWHLSEVEGKTSVVFLASLSRHTKAVNVVRFSPNGPFDQIYMVFFLRNNFICTGLAFYRRIFGHSQ